MRQRLRPALAEVHHTESWSGTTLQLMSSGSKPPRVEIRVDLRFQPAATDEVFDGHRSGLDSYVVRVKDLEPDRPTNLDCDRADPKNG